MFKNILWLTWQIKETEYKIAKYFLGSHTCWVGIFAWQIEMSFFGVLAYSPELQFYSLFSIYLKIPLLAHFIEIRAHFISDLCP